MVSGHARTQQLFRLIVYGIINWIESYETNNQWTKKKEVEEEESIRLEKEKSILR